MGSVQSVSKKATTTRVHQLAKELGVNSKDIVAKCQAEDVPNIVNHMSTVSVGLALTIREWFSAEDAVGTAVQTAAPVDVETARARVTRRPSKARRKADDEPVGEDMSAEPETEATAAVEAETVEPEVAEPVAAAAPELVAPVDEAPPVTVEEAPVEAAAVAAAPAAPQQAPPAAAPAPEEEAPTEPASRARINVPDRPAVVMPAGPQLEKPTKVKLAGPKVIRVEQPEHVPLPQPRRGPGGGVAARRGPDAAPELPVPARGRHGTSTSPRNKRRSASAREEPTRPGRLAGTEPERPFNWREQDLLERERRLNRAGGFFRAARRDNLKRQSGGGQRATTAAESGGVVRVAEPITIKELSSATGVRGAEILKKLMLAGQRVTINSVIDSATAVEIMLELGIELEVTQQQTAQEKIAAEARQREMKDERKRSPVVTILGHVDHGKTSLLDRIRNTKVAAGEAGGITQATSAFQVPVTLGDNQRQVTFIDTPGHEAFAEMRSRGARVTDIAVLVVAADDGVMPQTVESIQHAKAAGVPVVVALNKIDRAEATDGNIQRILGQLAEHELNPVEWGGSTEVVRTSATTGQGVQDLLEVLDYQAELMELTADWGGLAEGTVLEAALEEGRGAVAKVLVQQGTLKKGDIVVAGRAYGRVRDIVNDHGVRVDSTVPSSPVAISGINDVPDAGDKFYVVKTLKEAEAAAEERTNQERQRELATERITLDNIFQKLSESGRKELPLIVKADVQGSVDALRGSLEKISTDDVTVVIKHAAVGGINDSDVLLAETTGAIIMGFNVTAPASARRAADAKKVDIRLYDVIYDVLDDVKKAAEGLLEPEYKLEVLGHAEVRQVFKISRIGMVAGCYVTDGVIERNAQIRVTRDGIVVEKDRRLEQLKHFKDDAREVRAGQECGMRIVGYDDIRAGDVLECYKTLEVRKSL
jgi:translation initiation factor IF-2